MESSSRKARHLSPRKHFCISPKKADNNNDDDNKHRILSLSCSSFSPNLSARISLKTIYYYLLLM